MSYPETRPENWCQRPSASRGGDTLNQDRRDRRHLHDISRGQNSFDGATGRPSPGTSAWPVPAARTVATHAVASASAPATIPPRRQLLQHGPHPSLGSASALVPSQPYQPPQCRLPTYPSAPPGITLTPPHHLPFSRPPAQAGFALPHAAATIQPALSTGQFPPIEPMTRGYQGAEINTYPVALQPAHLNLSFWVEGLPPNLTHAQFYRLVLPRAAFGRVYQVHINEPDYGYDTSAAKLTFFDLQGAINFYAQWCNASVRRRNDKRAVEDLPRWLPVRPGFMGVRKVKVTRNRNPVYEIPSDMFGATGGPRHSRVLIFVGTVEKVNQEWLTSLFNHMCKSWEVEHWDERAPWGFYGNQHPRRMEMVRKMTVRFGSYRCQAATIWNIFRSRPIESDGPENMREGVACGFGWDPCCDRKDPHWGWEMDGVEWVNRRWMDADLLRTQPGPVQATQPTHGGLGAQSGPVGVTRPIDNVLRGQPVQDTEPTGSSSNNAHDARPDVQGPSSKLDAPEFERPGSVDNELSSESAATSSFVCQKLELTDEDCYNFYRGIPPCPSLSTDDTDSARSQSAPGSPPPPTDHAEDFTEKLDMEESRASTLSEYLNTLPPPMVQAAVPTQVTTTAQGEGPATGPVSAPVMTPVTTSNTALTLTPSTALAAALVSPAVDEQRFQNWDSDLRSSTSFADFLERSWRMEAQEQRKTYLESLEEHAAMRQRRKQSGFLGTIIPT